MMGWLKDSVDARNKPIKLHKFFEPVVYQQLDSVIAMIDSAFEGPVDTVHFFDSLVLKGTRALIDVAFLQANPNAVPARITPLAAVPPDEVPAKYSLYQNYPNPFNPTTTIQFDLPEASMVTLKVYNILGQEVATLVDGQAMDEGQQQVDFNASNYASGVYFYRLTTQSVTTDDDGAVSATQKFVSVKKMLLVK